MDHRRMYTGIAGTSLHKIQKHLQEIKVAASVHSAVSVSLRSSEEFSGDFSFKFKNFWGGPASPFYFVLFMFLLPFQKNYNVIIMVFKKLCLLTHASWIYMLNKQ